MAKSIRGFVRRFWFGCNLPSCGNDIRVPCSKEEQEMLAGLSTRRNFATRLASLFAGAGVLGLASDSAASAAPGQNGVRKLDYDGKPSNGTGFITPLIVHSGVIYIAGQGAHSRDEGEIF